MVQHICACHFYANPSVELRSLDSSIFELFWFWIYEMMPRIDMAVINDLSHLRGRIFSVDLQDIRNNIVFASSLGDYKINHDKYINYQHYGYYYYYYNYENYHHRGSRIGINSSDSEKPFIHFAVICTRTHTLYTT